MTYDDADTDSDSDDSRDTLVVTMREAFRKKGYSLVRTAEYNSLRMTAEYHQSVCDTNRGDTTAMRRVKEEHQRADTIKKQAGVVLEATRVLVNMINTDEERIAKRVIDVCGLIDAKSRRVLAQKLGFPVSPTSHPSRSQIAACRRKYKVERDADLVGTLHQDGIITDDEHTYVVQNTQVPAADFQYRGYRS